MCPKGENTSNPFGNAPVLLLQLHHSDTSVPAASETLLRMAQTPGNALKVCLHLEEERKRWF